MSLLRFANRLLRPLGVEVARTRARQEKPWDHTFRSGIQAERQGGDANAPVEAAWGKPDWAGYFVPRVKPGDVLCEIGPGLGRWTRLVLDRVSRAYLVDYSQTVCDYWRQRRDPRLTVIQSGNTRLTGIPDQSVDLFLSLDVFVHLHLETFVGYLEEAFRVLKPGGIAVIDYLAVTTPEHVAWVRKEMEKQDCFGQEAVTELIFRYHDPRTVRLFAEALGFRFENHEDAWQTHCICVLSKPTGEG
jgi:ubiquinone/menaquinone biosynthesis C-methylase UbiE